MVYYPNIMLEWYPHVLIVSTLIPRGVDATTNIVEFYYPEDIALFEREFVEAEQAAYLETAHEDDEIAERMDAGRKRALPAGPQRGRARTSRRWRTACSTSTNSSGASSTRTSRCAVMLHDGGHVHDAHQYGDLAARLGDPSAS